MPVTDQVELDISPALDSIDTIAQALTAAAQGFGGSLADAIAAQPEITLPLVADTSALGGSIEGAIAAANTTVTTEADTAAMVAEIETAAQTVTAVVEVVADTSQAETDMAALTDTTNAAIGAEGSGGGGGSGALGLGAAFGSLTNAASSADTGLAGATGTIGSSIPVIGGAAVALGGLAAAGDGYFQSAVQMRSGQQRFNAEFGSFANEVQTIDIAGLNTSLGDLNLSLGSGTTQVKNALSNLALLGNQSGATGQQVADAAKQLEVLSANAVATNPALGSVGDVAEKLDRLLGRGGPRLAQYGISLNSAEIQARALQIATDRGSTSVTEFDKRAAGAQLAVEKLGGAIKENVDAGVENPIIKLRQFTAEFAKFTTSLGTPLISPIFKLLEDSQPVLFAMAGLLGTLLQAILPIGNALVEAFSPLLSGIFNTASDVIAAFIPVIQQVANIITSLLKPALSAMAPLFDALVVLASTLAESFQPILDAAAPLAELFGGVLGKLAEGAALALGAIVTVVAKIVEFLGPFLKFLNPLYLIGRAFGLVHDEASKAANGGLSNYATVSQSIIDNADKLAVALKADSDAFVKNEFTSSEFAKAGPGVVDSLRRMGISADALQKNLHGGEQGVKDFLAAAIEAGQVKIRLDGADVSAAQMRTLNGNINDFLQGSNVAVVQGHDLTEAFIAQANAVSGDAQAQFIAITAQQSLTDEQIKAIGVQAQATLGADTYANRLQILAQQQQETQTTQAANHAILTDNASAWTALAEAVANGTVNETNASAAAQLFGTDTQTVTQAIKDGKKAVEEFVATAVAKFPTVTSVYDDLKKATNPVDPQSLTNNLNAATLGALTFQGNIDEIAKKFPEVAKLLQEKGPEAASAFAATFLASSDTIQQGLENSITANKTALGTISSDIKDSIGTNVATATDLATQMTAGFSNNLDFSKVTSEGITEAGNVLTDASVIDPTKDKANTAGTEIGAGLSFGIQTGMANGFPGIEQAARDAVTRMQKAANEQAGIHSPSTLFAEIGGHLADGMAQGMNDNAAAVIAEAEAIVVAAAAAAQRQSITAQIQAAGTPGGATAPQRQVDLTANVSVVLSGDVPNPDKAQPFADALGQALAPQLVSAVEAAVAGA